MNTEPKILLTIYLEGGILMKGEPEVKKYVLTKQEMFPNQSFKGNSGKKIIKSGKYVHIPIVQSVATQKITMCKEAYDYMTSTETPSWYIPFKPVKERFRLWKKLKEEERLELHLARTCLNFGGKSFTYQVIDD